MQFNMDKGFDKNEIETLIKRGFAPPSKILQDHVSKKLDIYEYNAEIGDRLKELGRGKR